jgi:peptidoglycan/LPS O-acetylase OafA/YrhL
MHHLAFVGWLRVFLVALVVAHHAGQPYGPTGGSWPISDPVLGAGWLEPFFGVNAAFFMGFFFLIAGYFTPGSYDRKGGTRFVRDRLIRLGIPLLIATYVVFPALIYARSPAPVGFTEFYFGRYLGRWQLEMGHLWFVSHLLVYSLLYALWRTLRPGSVGVVLPPPKDGAVAIYAVALAVVGLLIRFPFPQDRWVDVIGLVPIEVAHLPQYASLFVIGLIAGRGRWFETISPGLGGRWFGIGAFAFLVAGLAMAAGDSLPLPFLKLWGFLEAFICVGMILGLTVLFRRFCARGGQLLAALEGNVYGVYLLHWFVVIAVQAAILGYAWSAGAKFGFVTLAALVASFALSALLRAIPAVRRVL